MNAQTPEVPAAAIQLAATNADILRAVQDGGHNTTAGIAHAAGRPTKNIARAVDVLVRDGLVAEPREGLDPPFYSLTTVGARALQAIDVAQGRLTLDAGPGAELLLAHHQIRPNPLNPRKHIDPVELERLADTIEADGDVLQNLVVFPADADGIHDIAAGERRWRAVGLLMARGTWPADKRLRAVQREASKGQVAYVALVENGQRENLTMLEEARGYRDLVAETGWSGREAALKTGRDPRTVQEMLKVMREASAENIARHEQSPADYTWEDLRNSVKRAQERDPEQADLEDILGGARIQPAPAAGPVIGGGGTSQPPKPPKPAEGPNFGLSPAGRVAMLELAYGLAQGAGEWFPVGKYWLDTVTTDLSQAGFVVFSHTVKAGGPHAGLTNAGRAWVDANGGVPLNKGALTVVRQKAGLQREGDGYATGWLNRDDAPGAPAFAPPPVELDAESQAADQGEADEATEGCPACGAAPGFSGVDCDVCAEDERAEWLASIEERAMRWLTELPDRTSPPEYPEMMLVTAAEVASFARAELANLLGGR